MASIRSRKPRKANTVNSIQGDKANLHRRQKNINMATQSMPGSLLLSYGKDLSLYSVQNTHPITSGTIHSKKQVMGLR